MTQGKWQEMIGAAAFVVCLIVLSGCQDDQADQRKAAEQGDADAQLRSSMRLFGLG